MMPMSNFGRFCGVCIEMQDQLGFSDPALNLDIVKQPLNFEVSEDLLPPLSWSGVTRLLDNGAWCN